MKYWQHLPYQTKHYNYLFISRVCVGIFLLGNVTTPGLQSVPWLTAFEFWQIYRKTLFFLWNLSFFLPQTASSVCSLSISWFLYWNVKMSFLLLCGFSEGNGYIFIWRETYWAFEKSDTKHISLGSSSSASITTSRTTHREHGFLGGVRMPCTGDNDKYR